MFVNLVQLCMGFAEAVAFVPDSDPTQKIFLPGSNAPVLLRWTGGWLEDAKHLRDFGIFRICELLQ